MIFCFAFSSSCCCWLARLCSAFLASLAEELPTSDVLALVDCLRGSGSRAMGAFEGAASLSDIPERLRARADGVGKLEFLSMASTVLRKRRKSASARMIVEERSMVFESSLTASISFDSKHQLRGAKFTVLKHLIKMLQMLHDDRPVLFQDR